MLNFTSNFLKLVIQYSARVFSRKIIMTDKRNSRIIWVDLEVRIIYRK